MVSNTLTRVDGYSERHITSTESIGKKSLSSQPCSHRRRGFSPFHDTFTHVHSRCTYLGSQKNRRCLKFLPIPPHRFQFLIRLHAITQHLLFSPTLRLRTLIEYLRCPPTLPLHVILPCLPCCHDFN